MSNDLRSRIRSLVQEHVAPHAAEVDLAPRHPIEALGALAAAGYCGAMVPEDQGGMGLGFSDYAIVCEEVTAGCASTGVTLNGNNSLVCGPILRFGTDEQWAAFLPRLASGAALGAYALTEPGAGSDPAAIRTTAVLEGDEWVLSGEKMWITNAPIADLLLVFARTDPNLRGRGISAFIVDTATPGLVVGKHEPKMGLRGSATSAITFSEVRIPRDRLLGSAGQGLAIALATLDSGRVAVSAQALGIARSAFGAAVAVSRHRQVEGDRAQIADMALAIHAGRTLVTEAARKREAGTLATIEAALVKLWVTERAVEAVLLAGQVVGVVGLRSGHPVERALRDIKVFEVFEGTSEIQRLIISRHLVGK